MRTAWASSVALGILFTIVSAHAQVPDLSFSDTIPFQTIDWYENLQLSKFPPSRGALTGIDITLKTEIVGEVGVENINNKDMPISLSTNVQIQIQRPNGSGIASVSASTQKEDFYSSFDGTEDFSGPSGKTYTTDAENEEHIILTDLTDEDIELFTGNDTIILPVVASGSSRITGVGHIVMEENVRARATVNVTYTFVEPDLSITLLPEGSLKVGQETVFTVLVTNEGNDTTVGDIVVQHPLRNGITFVSGEGADWSCDVVNGNVECTFIKPADPGVTLPTLTLRIAANAGALPSVVQTVEVLTRGDTNAQNNIANAAMIVAGGPSSNSNPSFGSAQDDTGVEGQQNNAATSQSEDRGRQPQQTSFQFSQESGAFGGTATGMLKRYDAQGCVLPETLFEPQQASAIEMCLSFIQDRPLTFTDTKGHPYERFIEILKNTKLTETGEFIVGGAGNHAVKPSSQPSPLKGEGVHMEFPFEPDRGINRLELAKLAILSNCIPLKAPTNIAEPFEDVEPTHEVKDVTPLSFLISQVVYTAADHGILEGYPDGTVRPLELAANIEVLAVLLRAANALPQGYEVHNKREWYQAYLVFARNHYLVPEDFDPTGHMSRGELSKLIIDIMALNPDPTIHAYAAQLHTRDQTFAAQPLLYSPLPVTQDFDIVPGSQCEDRIPAIRSCFAYNGDRPIRFSDVTQNDPAATAINFLKNTRIAPAGDYIVSGHGNHSTGVQEKQFRSGTWQFQPDRSATRLEVVKTALITNCIPILDYIPTGTPTFTDVPMDLAVLNAADSLVARVFATAAVHGIIEGYPDGSAHPLAIANRLETLAILLRSAGAIPKEYFPEPLPFMELDRSTWAVAYVGFAFEHNFLPWSGFLQPSSPILRRELSSLLVDTMRFNSDIRVRAYMTTVGPLLR